MPVKISELSEASAIADTDVLHLRSTGGVDFKITGANARNSIIGAVVTATSSTSINLSSYSANLTVIVNGGATALDITFTGKLPDGRVLKIINVCSVQGSTVVVDSETFVLNSYDFLEFVADDTDMKIADKYHQSYVYSGTAFTHTILRGTQRFVEVQLTADGTAVLTEGANVTPNDWVKLWNNSSYILTVSSASETFYVSAGQTIKFKFINNTLVWATTAWEDIVDLSGNTSPSITLTDALEDGEYRVVMRNSTNMVEARFPVNLTNGTTAGYGPWTINYICTYTYSTKNLDSGLSSYYPIRLQKWHEAA